MIGTSSVILWIISETLGMSLLQKIFKRNKKQLDKTDSVSGTYEQSNACVNSASRTLTPCSRRKRRNTRSSERRQREYNRNVPEELGNSDDESDETSGDCDDNYTENRKRKLKSQIYKLRKQREKLRKRQADALALEQEIRQVISLLSLAKKQSEALKDEILNKKCELTFLGTEVPEGYEMEAKKKEPVFYKKYNAVKSASEARNLIENVQQKVKALYYIELLTYNKYLDYKHELKSNAVKHRSGMLSKNKKRNFGPLKDAIKLHAKAEHSPTAEEDTTEQDPDAIPLHAFATVTIESSPQQESSAEMTSTTTPQVQIPLLPAHLFRGPLSLTSSANMATETFI